MSQQSIIVGTNFSPTCHTALVYARQIATGAGMSIGLSHALVHPAFPTTRYDEVPNDLAAEYAAATERLRAEVDSLAGDTHIDEASVQMRPVVDALTSDPRAQLVVVGHAARKFGDRVLRGSVATRLARTSNVPVLVVPEGTTVRGARKIIVCDDFSHPSERIGATLERLGITKNAEMKVIFVVGGEAENGGHRSTSRTRGVYDEARDRGFAAWLQERAESHRENYGGKWSSEVLKALDVGEAICEYARASNADMVAIASTGKGAVDRVLLGSVAEQVMHTAGCPILIVH